MHQDKFGANLGTSSGTAKKLTILKVWRRHKTQKFSTADKNEIVNVKPQACYMETIGKMPEPP